MRRPAGAREALGLGPLAQAGGAHSTSVECVPMMAAGARPGVFLAGRPAAQGTADLRPRWPEILFFTKLGI
jgi:hypothetical protein